MHEHVVTALTKALGEMMGDVDTLQSQIDARKLDIDGAKRTLLFFDPNAQVGDVRAVRKRGKQTLKRGEASSSIIELLKTAPLTAEQITIKIADSRNIALGTDAYRTSKQCVIVMRERNGSTLTFVVANEAQAIPLVYKHIDPSAEVFFDMGIHWQSEFANFRAHFANAHMLNHSQFREEPWGVHTNNAESLNDRLRRLSHVYTRVSGDYLDLYAAEAAWRRDHRTEPNGTQVKTVVRTLCSMRVSRRFGNARRVPKKKPAPPFTPRRNRTY